MMVPESIRSVPRPTNTVVVDSGHNGALRYAVRERAGVNLRDRKGRYIRQANDPDTADPSA